MRTLKIILTEFQTNPSVQMATAALTVVIAAVFVTVLVVKLSGQQQKR